jgi:hypothetical protein
VLFAASFDHLRLASAAQTVKSYVKFYVKFYAADAPRTNDQKRPDRHSGDQASDLHLLGSGGGI